MKYFAFIINEEIINTVVAEDKPEDHDNGIFIEYDLEGAIRFNPAVKGGKYDVQNDAFILPQPFNSWTLNNDTFKWEAPVEKPEGFHRWDENTLEWVVMQ